MPRARLMIIAALAVTVTSGAMAGSTATAGDAQPPPAARSDEEGLEDKGTVVAPWEREGAAEPEAGADDDPTPFNPAEAPPDPLENQTDPLPE